MCLQRTIWIWLAAFLPPFAHAGTADVGGGTGVVCRDPAGKLLSVELLDLVEGKATHHYTIPESAESSSLLAGRLLNRLRFGFDGRTFETASPVGYLGYVQRIVNFAPAGYHLNSPSDLGKRQAVLVPDGCKLELIGQREKIDGRARLTIVPAYFEAMSKTHRAAFWVHEAIYSFYQSYFNTRLDDEEGTARIRQLTAALFASDTELAQLVQASRFLFVLDQGKVYCDLRASNARVELRGRADAFDRELDPLREQDAPRLTCGPASKTSEFEAPGRLVLAGDAECFASIRLDGLNAALYVNGDYALPTQGRSQLNLSFLRDQPGYPAWQTVARYPTPTGPLPKERSKP